ncbi:hypothetical protein BC361_31060 [Ensifer sp. LC54]|nr:hypothetical protein BC361_31060 [Ensifer sp. LC54]OCP19507.1 hypothetical protein BC363_31065 [Ensifer sp. LC384]
MIGSIKRRTFFVLVATVIVACLGAVSAGATDDEWTDIVSRARGQTVYWNAWGGDERTNSFIDWVDQQVRDRYGVTVRHVKLADTAAAVSRAIAEKSAGRDSNGAVDLLWINGPNFLSMNERNDPTKRQGSAALAR